MAYPKIKRKKVSLKEAVIFHGHLGPYLVLGLKAGEFALAKLKAQKYFDITVKVFGLDKKPKSCIIDGLQLSTGATYGKGNIKKIASRQHRIEFFCNSSQKKLALAFKQELIKAINSAKNHQASEALARKISGLRAQSLFKILQ
jgi:formylmethanofuran dehydrogenase subunit E